MPLTRYCKVCSKKFSTYPSKIKIGRGKYCSKRCCLSITAIQPGQRLSPDTEIKPGQKPWNTTGWRYTLSRPNGKRYRLIHLPNHPDSTSDGYVREHRLIAEQVIGRRLKQNEVVHHVDGDTLNNSPENLQVLPKKVHDRMNTPLNIHRRWQERRII